MTGVLIGKQKKEYLKLTIIFQNESLFINLIVSFSIWNPGLKTAKTKLAKMAASHQYL